MARTNAAAPEMSVKKITVLYTDLRAFSELFAGLSPKEFAAMTDTYYRDAGEIIAAAGGTIDKFIGDSVVALFNAEKQVSNPEKQALEAALQLRERIEERWPGLPISIGIATGKAVVGRFGPKFHRPFTAFGQVIHRASVLERRSHFTGFKILVDADTHTRIGRAARADAHPTFKHAALEGKGVYEISVDARPSKSANGRSSNGRSSKGTTGRARGASKR